MKHVLRPKKGSSIEHMLQQIEYVLYYVLAEEVDTAERQERNTILHKQTAAFRLGKSVLDLLSE